MFPLAAREMTKYILFHFQDACTPVILTVLDKCHYMEKVVISKALDSDANGKYPPDKNSQPDAVLRQFVSSHDAVSPYSMYLHSFNLHYYTLVL